MHWGLARAYIGLQDVNRALAALERAEIVLGKEEVFGKYLEGLHIQIDAMRDPSGSELRDRLTQLERAAGTFQAERNNEPTSARDIRDIIGRAAFECGEWGIALTNFRVALDSGVRPVAVPRVRYAEGECLRELGREEEAREAWHLAVETGLDTLYARLARRRLLGQEVTERGIVG